MGPIVDVDEDADKQVDEYFSQRPLRTYKLIDPKKLHKELMSEAKGLHEKFVTNKAKSYKAGFDNGFNLGYYNCLVNLARKIAP